jgi:multiple sugar transport system ATP-binding protein
MRTQIAHIQRTLGVTTIYVTHDQIEAMTMADRVAVMKDGCLQQVDTPQNVYDAPTNVFVAAFMGSPSMNLYDATVSLTEGGGSVTFGSQTVGFGLTTRAKFPSLDRYAGRHVIVGIRPEDFEDAAIAPDAPADQRIKGDVKHVEALGPERVVHFTLDASRVDSGDPDTAGHHVPVDTANAVARFHPESDVYSGTSHEIVVDTDNLQFFDADTRDRIS